MPADDRNNTYLTRSAIDAKTEPPRLMPAEPTSTQLANASESAGAEPTLAEAAPVIRANSIHLGDIRGGAMRVVFFTNPAHVNRPAPHARMRTD